ncbi:MAG: hypothetical protein U0324_08425 [Polyangiales bacterium]
MAEALDELGPAGLSFAQPPGGAWAVIGFRYLDRLRVFRVGADALEPLDVARGGSENDYGRLAVGAASDAVLAVGRSARSPRTGATATPSSRATPTASARR